jgi:1,2-dihydroxy-3-keto-5-methylthiopentene dioxygenase
MTVLVSFERDGTWGETWVCDGPIADRLAPHGIGWGRWADADVAAPLVPAGADFDRLLKDHREALAPLRTRFGVQPVERLRIARGALGGATLRRQLRVERTQSVGEVHAVLDGTGLFVFRVETGFLGLLCEAGEWVAAQAAVSRYLDVGKPPRFDALRLLGAGDPAERPTGAPVVALPDHDAFVEQMLALTGNALDDE